MGALWDAWRDRLPSIYAEPRCEHRCPCQLHLRYLDGEGGSLVESDQHRGLRLVTWWDEHEKTCQGVPRV